MISKKQFSKAYAMDKAIEHLSKAMSDRRRRERKRAEVALENVNEWLRQGEEAYEKEKEITGLDKVSESIVFHAGTKLINNNVASNGGRVVALTSYGNTLNEALQRSYDSIKGINFDKMNFRKDIGFDL